MSHRYALMLRTSLRSLRKQKRYVRGEAKLAAKYAEGERFWKLLYGGRLFNEARAQLATNRHVWRARWHLIVLVRHLGLGQVRAWFANPPVAEAAGDERSP